MADPNVNPNMNWQQGVQQPMAQAPVTPQTQNSTPAAPIATQTPTGNTTTLPGQTPPAAVTQSTTAPDGSKQTTKIENAAAPITMPENGSVVDLLNAAGSDSSFAARTELAKQYGIQGYTGTAAQNADLGKKYIDAHKALSGTQMPDTGAQARSAIGSHLQENTQQQDPEKKFFDAVGSMNPIQKQIYDTITQTLSSIKTQETLGQEYQNLVAQQGIPALQTQLMNINNIMNGTEQDIRDEILNAGGFGTSSQIAALTGARNKTLLNQANAISQQLALKQDYVSQVMAFSQADKAQVEKQINDKLNLTNSLSTLSNQMTNAAKDNYNNIIKAVGYAGLAASLQGNPEQLSKVENLLGLAPGELQSLADYTPPTSPEDQLKLQNLKLQNQKLSQDINQGPALSTQVVDIGGKKVLINSKTGQTIADLSGGNTANPLLLAATQDNINSINNLIKDPNLESAVGPNSLARVSLTNLFTGGKSNFLAGVQQVSQQLTLQNLQNAKANGATFGALSDSELGLLSSSASKLNTWAIKDIAGNVIGYNVDEKDFKAELDKVGNYAKLDFVLKGGDPSAVGIQEQADGTYWTENSDGTFTQIQ